MTDKQIFDSMKNDSEIPKVVQERANAAFGKIKTETARAHKNTGKKTYHRFKSKWPLLVAATLVFSTLTVAATAYRSWSRSLEKELHVTEEQKQKLETDGVTDMPGQSVTDQGVTITMQQSIVDKYNGYLSFKVEGFDLPEGSQPGLESATVIVDKDIAALSAAFYDGIVSGDDGTGVYDDGTTLTQDENGNVIRHYVQEDGSMELRINLMMNESGYSLVNKPIHVLLKNLGIYQDGDNGGFVTTVEGDWSFDWTLGGTDALTGYETNTALGDTGATVYYVEISPITLNVLFDFPRQIVQEEAVAADTVNEVEEDAVAADTANEGEEDAVVADTANEVTEEEKTAVNGETVTANICSEPPRPVGVRLKDGTLLTGVFTGSSYEGYVDEEGDTYRMLLGAGRLLDVEEIDALLFVKSHPQDTEGTFTEEDLYIVPLENAVTDTK